MDTTSFGLRLRQEREARQVSIEALSRATRIPVRLIEALENESWDQLPGGIFNRGFVRAISEHLGLDPEAFAAAYAVATNDHPQLRLLEADAGPAHPSALWMVAAVAILIVALVAGGWVAFRHFRPQSHLATASHLRRVPVSSSARITGPR